MVVIVGITKYGCDTEILRDYSRLLLAKLSVDFYLLWFPLSQLDSWNSRKYLAEGCLVSHQAVKAEALPVEGCC
jgi:hypothetical protein